jgi:hypothetical protein
MTDEERIDGATIVIATDGSLRCSGPVESWPCPLHPQQTVMCRWTWVIDALDLDASGRAPPELHLEALQGGWPSSVQECIACEGEAVE